MSIMNGYKYLLLLPGVQTHRVVPGAALAPVDYPNEHGLVPGQGVQRAPRVPLHRGEQLATCAAYDVT